MSVNYVDATFIIKLVLLLHSVTQYEYGKSSERRQNKSATYLKLFEDTSRKPFYRYNLFSESVYN